MHANAVYLPAEKRNDCAARLGTLNEIKRCIVGVNEVFLCGL